MASTPSSKTTSESVGAGPGRCSFPRPIRQDTPSATFGEAWAVIGGVKRKIHFFVLSLPHSDGFFVKAYPAETTEAFCDGHVSAFRFLGGVPQSVLYDNTTLAAAKILGDRSRRRTRVFTELQSHDGSSVFTFELRFSETPKDSFSYTTLRDHAFTATGKYS